MELLIGIGIVVAAAAAFAAVLGRRRTRPPTTGASWDERRHAGPAEDRPAGPGAESMAPRPPDWEVSTYSPTPPGRRQQGDGHDAP